MRSRCYLSELRPATYPQASHSYFCSHISPTKFLAADTNLSSSTAPDPNKVGYLMLKHLPRSGMHFLLHIFNLSRSLHSFPSIWKTSFIISIHEMEKPLDSSASFRPISLAFCVSKLFEPIILLRLFFFMKSISILSSQRPVSALDDLLSIKFCFFLGPFQMLLTDPSLAFRRFVQQSTSSKFRLCLTSRSFSHTYFS